MPTIYPDEFSCPGCGTRGGRIVSTGITNRKYSARALALPYFVCGDCRLCGYSKLLINQCIGLWRNGHLGRYGPHTVPYRMLHAEMHDLVNDWLDSLEQTAGYRRAKFRYQPK